MPGKLIIHATLLFTLFVSGVSTPAAAPSPMAWSGNTHRLAAKQAMSLEQAVAKVQRETNGRILTAETINREGRSVHRIKVLLPNGNVRVVHVDAE